MRCRRTRRPLPPRHCKVSRARGRQGCTFHPARGDSPPEKEARDAEGLRALWTTGRSPCPAGPHCVAGEPANELLLFVNLTVGPASCKAGRPDQPPSPAGFTEAVHAGGWTHTSSLRPRRPPRWKPFSARLIPMVRLGFYFFHELLASHSGGASYTECTLQVRISPTRIRESPGPSGYPGGLHSAILCLLFAEHLLCAGLSDKSREQGNDRNSRGFASSSHSSEATSKQTSSDGNERTNGFRRAARCDGGDTGPCAPCARRVRRLAMPAV